jgi:copper resistance protein B
VRHDLGVGPQRNWLAFGVQGLAPYWFELQATGYASSQGRLAARLRAEYTVRFTQRLMLQPELELNLYNKDDPAQRIGSGVSDAELGLRLRYEVTRQFAPYVGVVWSRRFGTTAAFARADGQPVFDRQWVAGIRFWF